jgi:hypothetical protein
MKLTNFYSNIWIISNFDNEKIATDTLLTYISKVKQNHNITKTINLDKEFKFWTSTYSSRFNQTISTQMILDSQKKALALFNKLSVLIINSFINQQQILIFTSIKNDCLLGLLVYFVSKEGCIDLEKAINTVNSKLGCLRGFQLDSNIKKILISECIKKISR